jgi:hypothetical protein
MVTMHQMGCGSDLSRSPKKIHSTSESRSGRVTGVSVEVADDGHVLASRSLLRKG